MATSRKIYIAVITVAIAAVILLYFIYDPAVSVWAPKCVFHAITGYDCPGCGSQRMIHALLHGDIAQAWHANAFLLCASPWLALMAVAACFRTSMPRLYSAVNSLPAIIITAAAIIAWTILRNIC